MINGARIVRQTTFIIALLMSSAVPARAQIQPFWDSITLTASHFARPVTIHVARGAGRLTSLVATTGTQSASVPEDELKDTPAPDLGSVQFSYVDRECRTFFVSVEMLRVPQPPSPSQIPYATPLTTETQGLWEIVYFYFNDAQYSRKERWHEISVNVTRLLVEPKPGNEYLITGPYTYREGPAKDPATGQAWCTANEFVRRTALGERYVLPATGAGSRPDPLGGFRDGVFHVKFRGKQGQGDLLVEVHLRSTPACDSVRILAQNTQ